MSKCNAFIPSFSAITPSLAFKVTRVFPTHAELDRTDNHLCVNMLCRTFQLGVLKDVTHCTSL